MVPTPHQALRALPSMPYDNRVDIFLWLLTWEGLYRWHLTGLKEEFIALPMTPCLVDLLCDSVVFAGWTDSWRPLVCLQQGCRLEVEVPRTQAGGSVFISPDT